MAIWETDPTHADYFTAEQGELDADDAIAYAHAVGQPAGTPIYYTVDVDVSPGLVENYFKAVDLEYTRRRSEYPVGAYAGGAVLEHLLNQKLITYAYLAQSMGWEGSRMFSRWNIRQGPSITVAGLTFDSDETRGHGGGFKVSE